MNGIFTFRILLLRSNGNDMIMSEFVEVNGHSSGCYKLSKSSVKQHISHPQRTHIGLPPFIRLFCPPFNVLPPIPICPLSPSPSLGSQRYDYLHSSDIICPESPPTAAAGERERESRGGESIDSTGSFGCWFKIIKKTKKKTLRVEGTC